MANIFVSYNRRSKEVAATLVEDLGALGHQVWYDHELSGGQAWWDQILVNVRRADVFVFVLDPASLESIACTREYGYAAALGKPILPVLVADGVTTSLLPPALSRIQFVDYRRPDRQAGLRLGRTFALLPPAPPLPDPLPSPPEVPLSYLGGLAEQVGTTTTLSYPQQTALLMDLRRGLLDPEAAKDARTLLGRFRKRPDLLAAVADEIDGLIGKRRPEMVQRPSTDPPTIQTGPPRPVLIGAAVGGAFGLLLGTSALIGGYTGIFAGQIIIGLIGGAVTAALIGDQRTGITAAVAGAVLWYFFWTVADSHREMIPWMLEMPAAGAVVGAIVWKLVTRRSGRAGGQRPSER